MKTSAEARAIIDAADLAGGPRFGPGCRCVLWPPHSFTFTADQAAVVSFLRLAWLNRTPDVPEAALLDRLAIATPLRALFRIGRRADGHRRAERHPALGVMIIRGRTRGTYRLAGEPPAEQLRLRELLAPVLQRSRHATPGEALAILQGLADLIG